MYESEANQNVGSIREVPADVVARFAESRATVTKRTLIPWGEHCTECVWPTCYSTCDLYSARWDGRCRRFVEGMVRIDCSQSLNGYLLKVSFKRWAKLWAAGNVRLYGRPVADRITGRDLRLAASIQAVPLQVLKIKLAQRRYSWKKKAAAHPVVKGYLPDCMLIECYNPTSDLVSMTLTIRGSDSRIPFQALLKIQPGFNRHRVAVGDIASVIDLFNKFDVELTPNEISDGRTLFFGALDFVIDSACDIAPPSRVSLEAADRQPRLCKCVVWDLDNTVWDGVLIEDGAEKLRLKPGIAEVFKTLDERGILISAVSKNNPEDALAVLRSFGLADYFLFPQISWSPKSQGLRQIAASLNIGLDSLLFVDDAIFEREEVQSQCPQVRVLDADDYLGIPDRDDCHALVTEESKKRRLLYREQQVRDIAQREFQGDYMAFLRGCGVRLNVRPMVEANLERVHELAQRTNQMNFSGNRYTREQLRNLLADVNVDTYVMECEDRFGAYGIIGFGTVHRPERCMTDLMFSCRIQAKRVEHAFVSHILRKYRKSGDDDFLVNFRKTKKNSAPGKVFEDFGFEIVNVVDGVTKLVYRGKRDIPDDAIVAIADWTVAITTAEMASAPV